MDMAYAISAILECPKTLGNKELASMTSDEYKSKNEITHGHSKATDDSLEKVHDCKYANFWVAYDALDQRNNRNLLEMGIELSKEMQKAIV